MVKLISWHSSMRYLSITAILLRILQWASLRLVSWTIHGRRDLRHFVCLEIGRNNHILQSSIWLKSVTWIFTFVFYSKNLDLNKLGQKFYSLQKQRQKTKQKFDVKQHQMYQRWWMYFWLHFILSTIWKNRGEIFLAGLRVQLLTLFRGEWLDLKENEVWLDLTRKRWLVTWLDLTRNYWIGFNFMKLFFYYFTFRPTHLIPLGHEK